MTISKILSIYCALYLLSVNSPSILEVGSALGIQLVPEIQNDIVEDGGVNVLGQLHEDEPVAIVALPQHGGDIVAVHGLDTVAEEQVADVLARHRHHPAIFCGKRYIE